MSAKANAARPSAMPTACSQRRTGRAARAGRRIHCRAVPEALHRVQCRAMRGLASAYRRRRRTRSAESENHPEAEALIAATGATIREGGGEAFYHRGEDFIRLPPRGTFLTPADFYCTALHELGHWTAHPSRLNRDLSTASAHRLRARRTDRRTDQRLPVRAFGHRPRKYATPITWPLAGNSESGFPRDFPRGQPSQQSHRFPPRVSRAARGRNSDRRSGGIGASRTNPAPPAKRKTHGQGRSTPAKESRNEAPYHL